MPRQGTPFPTAAAPPRTLEVSDELVTRSQQTVSVIIPAYNAAHFLPRSIQSILDQTVPVYEIIVVDDGSTDNTREVVAAYIANHGDRVRYIYQENKGLSGARNTAMHAATGDWIGILDADDEWLPTKHQRVQELLAEHPDARFIYHPSVMIYPNRRFVRPVLDPDHLWPDMRLGNRISGGSCALIRRSATIEIGDWRDQSTGPEDWDYWMRVAIRYPLHRIPEPLTNQWMYEGSNGSNPERFHHLALGMVDRSLLLGLTGIDRWLWRRRIVSYLNYDIYLELKGRPAPPPYRKYLWRSLAEWPSPFWTPKRWWSMARMLLRRPNT